jgi:hypothetical protein
VGGLSNLIPILLDFDRHEIEGDKELLNVPIRGDWILCDGASDEQVLGALRYALPLLLAFLLDGGPVARFGSKFGHDRFDLVHDVRMI